MDGLWPRHFSGTRPQRTRVQTSGLHVGCGPRTKEKMGIWHGAGDGGWRWGRVLSPIGGRGSTGSRSRSSLRAEAQRADAAQTRRIDAPENYFQIGDFFFF